jgi:hypothetical protein
LWIRTLALIESIKLLDKPFVVQVRLILLVSVTKKKEEKNLSTFFHAEDRNFEKGRHDTQHNNIQHNDTQHNAIKINHSKNVKA